MERVLLQDGDMQVALLEYGATTQGWWLGDTPLILGYDDPEAYRRDPHFLGAIVGRVANRIEKARFTLDGETFVLDPNEGPHQLHGGPTGLWNRDWKIVETTRSSAKLAITLPDGADGFPGALDVTLTVRLEAPSLTYDLRAVPDRPTPVSLAQHNYYCLGAMSDMRDATLRVAAPDTLALDGALIPTGALLPVAGTPRDFRSAWPLSQAGEGLDDFFTFDPDRDPATPVAVLTAPSRFSLCVVTDQPGAQVYTGHALGAPFTPYAGVCIEPSGYPNAVNIPAFPLMIATPDAPYAQTLRLTVTGGPS